MKLNTRIRYRKTKDSNVIESVQRFVHDSARYYVRLNTATKEFWVIEDVGDTPVITGEAINLGILKIKAKKALQTLGIEFEEKEVRARATKGKHKNTNRVVII